MRVEVQCGMMNELELGRLSESEFEDFAPNPIRISSGSSYRPMDHGSLPAGR